MLELVEGPTLADRISKGPNVRPGGFMPKAIRLTTGVTIAALLILLRPVSAVAQRHQGLVSISAQSTLSVSEFRELDALVDRMIRENELVLRFASDDRSVPDRRHERFSQYFRGVPVFGGGLSRQTAGGMTVSVFGAVYQQIELDLAADLSVDAAAAVLENVSGTTLVRDGRPSLTILPRLEGGYALTYRATMRNARTYFVDAHTGQVLVEVDERLSESAVGAGHGVFGDAKKVAANRVAGSFRTQDLLRPAEILTLDTRGSEAILDRLIDGTTFDSDIATDADNTWTGSVNLRADLAQ